MFAAKVSYIHKVTAVRFPCFLFTSLCSFTGVESGSYMQSVFHFVHDVRWCPAYSLVGCCLLSQQHLLKRFLSLLKVSCHLLWVSVPDSVVVHTCHRLCDGKSKACTLECINNSALTLAHWNALTIFYSHWHIGHSSAEILEIQKLAVEEKWGNA